MILESRDCDDQTIMGTNVNASTLPPIRPKRQDSDMGSDIGIDVSKNSSSISIRRLAVAP